MAKKSDYYRRITERLPKVTSHLIRLVTLFLLVSASILALFIILLYFNYQETREERGRAIDSLSYWQDVIHRQPNSPDAYYNAALYSLELGKREDAVDLLNHALSLDPSFDKAKKLESEILR